MGKKNTDLVSTCIQNKRCRNKTIHKKNQEYRSGEKYVVSVLKRSWQKTKARIQHRSLIAISVTKVMFCHNQ